MALQTTVEHVDGPEPVTVLKLDGELDGVVYEGVIDTVRGLYDAGTRILVLDLTGLSFISSSGLVAVHAAMRLMRGEAAPDTEQGWEALRGSGRRPMRVRSAPPCGCSACRTPSRRCSTARGSARSSRPTRIAPPPSPADDPRRP